MKPELCTKHASIDASRARVLLQEAEDDHQRLHQLYSDCFFDGSIAAAESAVQFAIKKTDSTSKAIALAGTLKSLPTAIPFRTARPLAELCVFLAFEFSEKQCGVPLRTFCYANNVIRKAALNLVLERLHDVVRMKTGATWDTLKRLEGFFDGITAGSEEIERRVVVGRLIRLAYGMSSQVRTEIFNFLLELDIRSSSSLSGKSDCDCLEDYDTFLAFELGSLAPDSKSMAQVLLRSLVRSFQHGTIDSLLILWTYHQAQMMRAISIIGRDTVLFLLLAQAVRLAGLGSISDSRRVVHLARHLTDCRKGVLLQLHEVVRSVLVTFCASTGSTSSAYGDKDLNLSLAEILSCLRGAETDTNTVKLLERLRFVSRGSYRWECPETTTILGLLLKMIELWTVPSQLKTWLSKYLTTMLSSNAISNEGREQGGGAVVPSSVLKSEEVASQECRPAETFGGLVTLLGISVLGHPASCVRLEAVEALCSLNNNKISLFCLPSILLHLQHEKNGVVAVKIIRELLCSPSLLQDKETSKIALNACMQSLGQSTAKDPHNSVRYETVIAALGYATESAPGLATSLLLKEVEKLNGSFGLTGGPVRASASSAILRLVESRPARGANFIPFISSCIAPESMALIPEAASLCFEAMNIMAEEEVLDPVKAVKIVIKNYSDVGEVAPKARRSYLKLLGSVSRGSSSKKGVVLAGKVVSLLRRCLTVMRLNSQRQKGASDCFISNLCSLSWEEVEQAAQSLGHFAVEEILRTTYSGDEQLLDVESEAQRREQIEVECQDFIQELLSLTAVAHDAKQNALNGLMQLLIKIVSHEWENRKRSSFDPDRIAKLQAASDSLRRARQARGIVEGDSRIGIDGFARAVKGLPTGVIKGVLQKCVWDSAGEKRPERASSFWIAVRITLAAKALSPALPWVALVTAVMKSPRSHAEERASCLAVLRALEDTSFELKDARVKSFGAQSALFDSCVPTSVVEAKELFVGMVHFNPSEIERLLFKFRAVTSLDIILAFVRAARELHGFDISVAARGLFPVIMDVCGKGNSTVCESIERNFHEVILARCEEALVEELLVSNITEPSAIRIACMTKSFHLLLHASRVVVAEGGYQDLMATVGLAIRSFDTAHRREFVLDVCFGTDDDELLQRQYWLTAHAYDVAALLPYTDLALSVAVCFCADVDRGGVKRTISSIIQKQHRVRL